ncbi:hypothetical protein MUY14_28755 [Amycolatopsis sp. FBCC-B4732]|uniref:hypothetical protein n=1 Tax=Amycolatopsis sp. FBCC-B4732 TaxID=3079339 RepID=UPI001FF45D32|nr:hypothetical protein [Amycolatopsis sp. FBCC-B4732]UOX85760.1 hypothetical protein MUY14_28755 [Amycolatopsis sp. FBCC-B4732]
MTPSDAEQDDELAPELREIADRAHAAGLKVWTLRWNAHPTVAIVGEPELRVEFPAGRAQREVRISRRDAADWASTDFAHWVFLGDYDAFLDRSSGTVVAALGYTADGFGLAQKKIPGLVPMPEDDPDLAPREGEALTETAFREPVRLRVEHPSVEGLSITIQRPPPRALRVACRENPRTWGVAITGVTTERHDQALGLLQEISTSFFIDLDLSYGLAFRLKKDYRVEWASEPSDEDALSTKMPRFPVLAHNYDAASLYLYARTLVSAPLLEYLAYYQVLEFFMPKYARVAAIQKLRDVLRDPRFDHDDDVVLGRIIEMVTDTGRASATEREQLKATVTRCVDASALVGYLEGHPHGAAAMADKKRISDVRLLNPKDTSASLVEQVADRIYDLRCRIVHGKEGGNGRGEPLRPFGRESKLLTYDLDLIRFVAQRVLITSSGPATWGR